MEMLPDTLLSPEMKRAAFHVPNHLAQTLADVRNKCIGLDMTRAMVGTVFHGLLPELIETFVRMNLCIAHDLDPQTADNLRREAIERLTFYSPLEPWGGNVFVSCDTEFLAPDGNAYRAAWGEAHMITARHLLAIPDAREPAWYVRVGRGDNAVIIPGHRVVCMIPRAQPPAAPHSTYIPAA